MVENCKVLCHSAIRIEGEKILYFDPYGLEQEYNDADYIFITHSHYDHFSKEDIEKVRKENTIIIVPEETYVAALKLGIDQEKIMMVEANKTYTLEEIHFKTVPAYNTNKAFHPKENGWLGYNVTMDKITYYIAGDTDITEEAKQVKCDVAFVPVSGVYTMTSKEAAELVNEIKPKIAVPTHYGKIVGIQRDAILFGQELKPYVECQMCQ